MNFSLIKYSLRNFRAWLIAALICYFVAQFFAFRDDIALAGPLDLLALCLFAMGLFLAFSDKPARPPIRINQEKWNEAFKGTDLEL